MSLNYRYPGTSPFTSENKDLFFGRDRDIKQLYDLILLEQLVVLYGRSGMGKTSLLNAGILPILEKSDEFQTMTIRFGAYTKDADLTPLQIVKTQLDNHFDTKKKSFLHDIASNDGSLWFLMKNLMAQPGFGTGLIVVMDQFEELFTYPQSQIDIFEEELGEALRAKMSKTFRDAYRDKVMANPIGMDMGQVKTLQESLNLKIVIGIRSDKISLLNKLRTNLPNIQRFGYELAPLTEDQAREAITQPAAYKGPFISPPFSYEEGAMKILLDFLLSRNRKTEDTAEAGIDSSNLQILCEYIEREVVKEGHTVVVSKDLENLGEILKNYYLKQLDYLALGKEDYEMVRDFIEEGLIFHEDKRRLSLYEGQIKTKYGVGPELLKKLVNCRLLRAETRTAGGTSFEIGHDTLVEPILKAREKRKQEEAERLAIEKAAEDQRQAEAARIAEIERLREEKEKQMEEMEAAQQRERLKVSQNQKRRLTVALFVLIGMAAVAAFGWLDAWQKSEENEDLIAQLTKSQSELAKAMGVAQTERDSAMAARNFAEIKRQQAVNSLIETTALRELAEKETARAISAEKSAKNEAAKAQLAELKEKEKSKELEAKTEMLEFAIKKTEFLERESYWYYDLAEGEKQWAMERVIELQETDSVGAARVKASFARVAQARRAFNNDSTNVAFHLALKAKEIDKNQITNGLLADFIKNKKIDYEQKYELPGNVRFISLVGNEEKFLAGTSAGVYEVDLKKGENKILVGDDFSFTNTLFLSNDQSIFATYNSGDETISLWSRAGKFNSKITLSTGDGYVAAAISPDNGTVAVNDGTSTLKLFNPNGSLLDSLPSHSASFYHLGFSPDGKYLLAVSEDHSGYLYNLAKKSAQSILEGHTGPVYFLDFSPKGNLIATSSYDGTVKIWDYSGKNLKTLEHGSEVYSVRFSPDGKYLMTGEGSPQDGISETRLWDWSSGQALKTFSWHDTEVWASTFFKSGRKFLTGGGSEVYLWGLDSKEITVDDIVSGRKLTPLTIEEKKAYGLLDVEAMKSSNDPDEIIQTCLFLIQESENDWSYSFDEKANFITQAKELLVKLESINLSQQQRAEVYSMQAKMDMAWLFENRYDLSEDLLLEKIAQAVELRLKALESSEPGLDKFIATSEAFASDAGNWELDVNYSAALQLRKAGAMLWQENLRRFPEDITANQQAGAAYHNLAMAHERQVDYGEAAKWYQWAVDIKSWLLAANGSEDVSLLVDLVTTLSSAADLYEKTGRASDAQASYLKITEIATQEALEYQSDPDLFVKISVAHRKLGNLDKALSLCTAGLEISDTDDDVWNEKGLVYIEKKDYPNALNCFDKAIEYYSIYAAYYRNKAGALYELSRLEDAVKAMEEAYEWGLSDVAVLNDYGFFHARAGYFDEAKTKLEEGLLYAPDDANLNAHLGYVLLNTGNMQGGLDLVEKAISLDANYAKSYFYLACFYSKLGNEGVAFTELQKAVALGFSEKQWAETEPLLANMREDRGRFGKLMKKMK